MKLADLKEKSMEELDHLLKSSRDELFVLRFKVLSSQHKKVRDIRNVRKRIARILTLMKQKKRA